MSDRSLPVGRVGRLVRLAGVGARSGASLLRKKSSQRTAQAAAEVLGTLRGLAAKLGQTASYVDGLFPEQHRHTYQEALAKLRDAAPSSSPEQVGQLIQQELGAPASELFAEFDDQPFASASIGQVHRAVLPDGRRVAVKVQHPGIDEAIESDLSNASMLEFLIGSVGPKTLNVHHIFEEVKQRFREELDYCLEAEHQAHFERIHAGDASIHIPRVITSHSARRVLTSELAEGATLERAAEAPEALRRQYAETLWRFVFKGNLVGQRFNADPHPGNYLFHEDGSITFLDFGCVQRIEGPHIEHAREIHRKAVALDEPGFERAVIQLLGLRGGSYQRAALEYVRRCFRPVFEAPFHLSSEYVGELVEFGKTMKREIFAKDKSFVPFPSNMVFMNRLQFGFYSVLGKLDVVADYREVERRFLTEAKLL